MVGSRRADNRRDVNRVVAGTIAAGRWARYSLPDHKEGNMQLGWHAAAAHDFCRAARRPAPRPRFATLWYIVAARSHHNVSPAGLILGRTPDIALIGGDAKLVKSIGPKEDLFVGDQVAVLV